MMIQYIFNPIAKISFVLLLLCNIGCEDFFDTTITIDPPAHTSKLVCVATAKSGDTTMDIRLSNSIGILDQDSLLKAIGGAKFDITLNGLPQIVTEEKNEDNEIYYKVRFSKPLAALDQLSLKASAQGFEPISSISRVPNDLKFSNLEIIIDGGNDEFGSAISKVRLDVESDVDAYFFGVKEEIGLLCIEFSQELGCTEYDTIKYTNTMSTRDIDAVNGYFVHQKASSKKKSYVFTSNRLGGKDPKYGVLIYDKTSFDYIISKDLYQDNNENPFSTPINVRSNIVNGYGNIELAHYVRLN